nr:immunoglobulin light chain junction region [Macaca mulatta]
CLQGDSAPFTF